MMMYHHIKSGYKWYCGSEHVVWKFECSRWPWLWTQQSNISMGHFSFTYTFVMLSILQSQFIQKGFKKAENSEQNMVLLLFLFTLVTYLLTIDIIPTNIFIVRCLLLRCHSCMLPCTLACTLSNVTTHACECHVHHHITWWTCTLYLTYCFVFLCLW